MSQNARKKIGDIRPETQIFTNYDLRATKNFCGTGDLHKSFFTQIGEVFHSTDNCHSCISGYLEFCFTQISQSIPQGGLNIPFHYHTRPQL